MVKSLSNHARLALIGVAAYVLFVLMRFPAAQAFAWFGPESVRLINPRGTVWNGHADAAQVAGIQLGETAWRWAPFSSLASFAMAYRISVDHDDGNVRGKIAGGAGGSMRAWGLQGNVPRVLMTALLPDGVDVARLGIEFERLELDAGWPQRVSGRLVINDVTMSAPLQQAFGGFEVLFADGQMPVTGVIRDLGGPLTVQGSIVFAEDRTYSLEGSVAANARTPKVLRDVLPTLGPAAPEGGYEVTFAGSF